MIKTKSQNIINRNIWMLRNRRGISTKEAAAELNVSEETLKAIEYKNVEPKASILLAVCEFYKVPDLKKLLTDLIE